MAKKNIEPIISLGNEDKLTVQKSLPLFALWRSELTLAEFKILDVYLSRINSHEPNKRTVVFEKGELENLLGVKRIRVEELDERLKHLGTPIRIDDNTSKNKKFARISLFEKALAEQDEQGIWGVELTASQSAMKYFFNIENLGYLRYKLRCITSLTSRYTYIMFIYLEANRFRKSWKVSLTEIKTILNCDKVETYSAFKEFNKQVLKRIHTEMHEKTECKYNYKPIKKGRSVVEIQFTLETLSEILVEEDTTQISLENDIDIDSELWEDKLKEFNFTQEQLNELRATLVLVSMDKLPQIPVCPNQIELMRYHYIDLKVKAILRKDKEKSIKNKYAYLLKMIQKDVEMYHYKTNLEEKESMFTENTKDEELSDFERQLLKR